MSHFSAHPRLRGAAKRFVPAIALALSLGTASAGHAAQYFLQTASMNTTRTANIDGPGGFHEYAYIAPISFTAFEGTGSTPATGALSGAFNLVAFCVDIFHNIGLGAVNLKYDDSYDLTSNSKYQTNTPFAGGAALSASQVLQVGRLVNYGTLIYNSGAATTDKVNRLAGLQGAIWQVVNPGYSVVSSAAAVNSYTATYSGANYAANLTGYGFVHSGATFISETGKYGTKGAHQSFAIAAVPEPSTWLMMIAGFGLIGATLRRSRDQLVALGA